MNVANIKKILRQIVESPTVLKNKCNFAFHRVITGSAVKGKGKIQIVNRGSIEMGSNCLINGHNKYDPIGFGGCSDLVTEKDGHIKIGDNFGMSNSAIYSRIGVTIGNNVMLGAGVKIYDTDFHSMSPEIRGTSEDKANTVNKPVVIGNRVFIGAGSMILKGVSIGDNAVIGAGSIVSKNVPANEVWAGNPAKYIRKV